MDTLKIIKNKKIKRAFTLVEIMIAVAIIATLATIAISSMLRSRMNANETLAVAACKTIVSASHSYYSNQETYPDSLQELALPNSNPAYIDSELASGQKAGYNFSYNQVDDGYGFVLRADPVRVGRTGGRYFYTDETGILTFNKNGPASEDDQVVQ